jgi:tetratricopeptide (TPR) repeat protein
MDKMSLETYHVLHAGSRPMTHLTKILLSTIVCLTVMQPAMAAKGRHVVRSGGGGGGGGVMLQTPNPVTAIDHNNRAVELGQKGIWADAIREHELALSLEPLNKDFRTNLSSAQLRYGNVLFKSGKTYEAMKQFRGALFVDPDNLPADEGLDACYGKMGRDPLNLQFRKKCAEDFAVSGHFEDAITEYRKCVKMDDSGSTHADLGYTLVKADKPVEGYQELKIAVQKIWKNDEKNDLAACHRKMGDILKDFAYKAKNTGRGTVGMKRLLNATTEYRRAVTLNPNDGDAIASFIEIVREGCAIKPCFDNYLMLGGGYLLAGDFAHAKIAYEQCYKLGGNRTELGPARVAFHQAVARSPMAGPELVAESISKVNKFLENDPNNERWWYILGRLKQHQGDNNGAMEAYRRAEKLNPLVDPDLAVQVRVLGGAPVGVPGTNVASATTGASNGGNPAGNGGGGTPAAPAQPVVDPRNLEAYSKIEAALSSNPQTAVQLCDEVLARDPANGHASYLKGNALQRLKAYEDAVVAYRQAAAFKEEGADEALRMVNTIRVQDNLQRAEEAIRNKDWIKAQTELQDAIIKANNLPILHRKLSEVMTALNDPETAKRELAKAEQLEKPKAK